MCKISILTLTAVASAAASTAVSNVVWDESIKGSFSSDGFAPTQLGVFSLGANRVLGTLDVMPDITPDYFSFEIAAGQQLAAIILERYAPASGEQQQSFIALQAGPQVTSEFDTSVFLGATLVGGLPESLEGEDILDDLATPLFGGQGFLPPLGPGIYSIWFQETAEAVGYTLAFVVVPAPTSALALVSLGLWRRRR
ncbi:MAG: hypothetical protein KF757_13895 [Phycisphaeraceae bacterium]|nr:hypothetical protein [Phycisphaeraceae bacterium]MCW5764055.1 hypothetical protein [Phycisphaeraceae bacterium]